MEHYTALEQTLFMPTIIRKVEYSQCNFMCLTVIPRIFITLIPALHPWVQCQMLCSSELQNLYIETLEKVGANFSRSLSQYKWAHVHNMFTICLQYVYIKLGRDEKSNDSLSAAAAEWMFMIINSGLFNSEAVGILPAASSNQPEVRQTCKILLTMLGMKIII